MESLGKDFGEKWKQHVVECLLIAPLVGKDGPLKFITSSEDDTD